MYDTQLAIRMKSETRDKLKQRAAREQRTTCNMARVILEKALQKEKLTK